MKFKFGSLFLISGLFLALFYITACKKKDTNAPEPSADDSFDKQTLLLNLADKVILPNYINFKKSLDSLSLSLSYFKSLGDLKDFQNLVLKTNIAYQNYQSICIFEFGPAEEQSIRANLNVFPSNTVTINSNIISGTYDFSANSNLAAKGFPALDFLLNGKIITDLAQVQEFKLDAKRMKYLEDVVNEMTLKTTHVISGWQATYRKTFVNSLGTDLGSSIGFLVNQINYELDFLKNYKLAIPLGLKSAGTAFPQNCEAFFSHQSNILALASLKTIEDLYLGRSADGSNGIGFDDYLDHLKAMHINQTLNQAIQTQFSNAKSKLQSLTDNLSDLVLTNPTQVKAAHDELVKLLVLLKTDMPSSLGVVITYQDGDGD